MARHVSVGIALALALPGCGGGGGGGGAGAGIAGAWRLHRASGYPLGQTGSSITEYGAAITQEGSDVFVDLHDVRGYAPGLAGHVNGRVATAGYATTTLYGGIESEQWTWTVVGDELTGTIDAQYFYGEYRNGEPVYYRGTDTFEGERIPTPSPLVVTPGTVPPAATGLAVSFDWLVRGGSGGSDVFLSYGGFYGPELPKGITATVTASPDPAYDAAIHFEGVPRDAGVFDGLTIRIGHLDCNALDERTLTFSWSIGVGPVALVDAIPTSTPAAALADPQKYADVSALPDLIFNVFTLVEFDVAGGTPPYRADLIDDPSDPDDDDPLPIGLSIPDGKALLVGAPQQVGPGGRPFRMTVRVADALGETATRKFQLRVLTPPPLITTASLPDATKDAFYASAVTAVDGIPPLAWSVSSGSLPAGLTLNPNTGLISGTPTTAGTATFTVRVADLLAASASKQFSLQVK
jgi:hypothetical protein